MRTRQAWRTAHAPIVYECERCLQINASAETVWDWMADARRLLSLNIFHVAVPYLEPVTRAGLCIPIMHHIWGLYRQTRIARIRAYRKYFVAWGEFQEHGLDRFPHSQPVTVVPCGGAELSRRQSSARAVPYSWGTVLVPAIVSAACPTDS